MVTESILCCVEKSIPLRNLVIVRFFKFHTVLSYLYLHVFDTGYCLNKLKYKL